jgi:hypothetical protein
VRAAPRGTAPSGVTPSTDLAAFLPKGDPLSAVAREPREPAAFLSATAARQRPDGPGSLLQGAFATDA